MLTFGESAIEAVSVQTLGLAGLRTHGERYSSELDRNGHRRRPCESQPIAAKRYWKSTRLSP